MCRHRSDRDQGAPRCHTRSQQLAAAARHHAKVDSVAATALRRAQAQLMWPTVIGPPAIPIVIESYPVLLALTVALGFAAALVLALRLASLPPQRVTFALLLLTAFALAGARLHFLWANSQLATAGWRPYVFWEGGVHAAGGLVGVLLAAPLASRLFRFSLAAFADSIAPAVVLSLALHRLACFARGCCFGSFCDYSWCVRYPQDSFAFQFHRQISIVGNAESASAPVHPLPLYYLLLSLLVMSFGLLRYRHRRYPGEVALLSLLSFSVGALLLEPYRAVTDATVFVGRWPQLSVTAASLAIVALALIAVAKLIGRQQATQHSA